MFWFVLSKALTRTFNIKEHIVIFTSHDKYVFPFLSNFCKKSLENNKKHPLIDDY